MLQYDSHNLIIQPGNSKEADVIVDVQPEMAGWNTIHFQVRRLAAKQTWSFDTNENELAIVVLSGSLDIIANCGQWKALGTRQDVFSGLPAALYLPRGTTFMVTAHSKCEFAVTWTLAKQHFAPILVTPENVKTEIRGGDHATRQINSILPPGSACNRLVVVEVYTPGGNWSSYPPHKHDVHRVDALGNILEADLDEIYFYKIDRPEGYALQRIYTDPQSPLHQAGFPIDATVIARNNSVVLVPEGYHPVSSPVGYTSYYLNVLAGSAQSLASYDDPQFSWIKKSYRSLDPRVPLYEVNKL